MCRRSRGHLGNAGLGAFLWLLRIFYFGCDLKDPVAALLGLVELKVELGGVFDVQGLVDFRLPLLFEGDLEELKRAGDAV